MNLLIGRSLVQWLSIGASGVRPESSLGSSSDLLCDPGQVSYPISASVPYFSKPCK